MVEKLFMGDSGIKSREFVLPAHKARELSDLIPKPENQFHYRITGEWQENREVYRVFEGDKVISDYSFPAKSDMSKVQFATRTTYSKEVNFLGAWTDAPVQFDRKTGTWKKLNIIQKVKQAFAKETNIPARVVTETVNGKETAVLHTLEQKRPVGTTVSELKVTTLQDAEVDLGLKYKRTEQKLSELEHANRLLKTEAAAGAATIAALRRELVQANRSLIDLKAQLKAEQIKTRDQENQANPSYEGPIYAPPNPEDVVEGVVTADESALGK